MENRPTVAQVETNPADFSDWDALYRLIRDSFRAMEGRIDPPSSILRMIPDSLAHKARHEDLFLLRHGSQPIGCVFGTGRSHDYYIGKLAVAAPQRHKGYARALIEAAATQASRHGCRALSLETRVELRENHRTFRRLGFSCAGASSHAGYERATSLLFRRAL